MSLGEMSLHFVWDKLLLCFREARALTASFGWASRKAFDMQERVALSSGS